MRTARSLLAFAMLLAVAPSARAQDQPPPPPAGKATLAVMDFSFTAPVDVTVKTRRNGRNVSVTVEGLNFTFETSELTAKFVTSLVKTGKFDVVERAKIEKLLQEQSFGESGIVDKDAAAKGGKVLGADYMLYGAISVFSATTAWKEIEYTGSIERTVTLAIIVDMQIVDVRTSKIVAAEKGDVRKVEKRRMNTRQAAALDPATIDELERDLTQQLVLKVIDAVYPIKIINYTAEGTAFLNRGEGGGLRPGDVLDVFSQGEEMVDPDTGASLGRTEAKVGRIRVNEVLAKFSKASVVGPAGFTPQKGQICRRAQGEVAYAPTPAPTPPPDRTPPVVEILGPRANSMLTSNPVNVVVRASDDSGRVARVLIVGREATSRGDGTWELKVTASEGGNRVVAEAFDAAGNRGTAEVVFQFKDRPPEVSGHAIVTFKGRVDDPKSKVTVNGIRVTVNADGSFEVQVKPDGNGEIIVVAVDEFGNETRTRHKP